MKNMVYIILSILLFWACSKEDDLTPSIQHEHLYGIENVASDSVSKKVYDIYQKYGVPVYFNDTIGKFFVKEDIYGDSVYSYETLDLTWGFTSNSGSNYRYEYMQTPEEKMNVLKLIEEYLELCPKALYPFNFFAVRQMNTVSAIGNVSSVGEDTKYGIFFRTLVLIDNGLLDTDLPQDLRMAMIKQKISNYPLELEMFNSVSTSSWYGVDWRNLDPNMDEFLKYPYSYDLYGSYYGEIYQNIPYHFMTATKVFDDDWERAITYEDDPWYYEFYSQEGLDKFRAMVRQKIGAWGFISPGVYTPNSTEVDLNAYLNEMLKISKEEFEARWGACPLVMEKYNILYEIVANKFGVEL